MERTEPRKKLSFQRIIATQWGIKYSDPVTAQLSGLSSPAPSTDIEQRGAGLSKAEPPHRILCSALHAGAVPFTKYRSHR